MAKDLVEVSLPPLTQEERQRQWRERIHLPEGHVEEPGNYSLLRFMEAEYGVVPTPEDDSLEGAMEAKFGVVPTDRKGPTPIREKSWGQVVGHSLARGTFNLYDNLATRYILEEHPEWQSEMPSTWQETLLSGKAMLGTALESAPFMAASTGAYVTGTAMGGPQAGWAAAFLVAFGAEGGEEYKRALAAGASEEEARTSANIYGMVSAIIELGQVGAVMRFAKGQAGRSAFLRYIMPKIRGKAGKLTLEIVASAVEEGLEEVAQGIAQEEIGRIVWGDPSEPREKGWLNRRILEFIGGAGAGGLLGGAGRITNVLADYASRGEPIDQEVLDAIMRHTPVEGEQAPVPETKPETPPVAPEEPAVEEKPPVPPKEAEEVPPKPEKQPAPEKEAKVPVEQKGKQPVTEPAAIEEPAPGKEVVIPAEKKTEPAKTEPVPEQRTVLRSKRTGTEYTVLREIDRGEGEVAYEVESPEGDHTLIEPEHAKRFDVIRPEEAKPTVLETESQSDETRIESAKEIMRRAILNPTGQNIFKVDGVGADPSYPEKVRRIAKALGTQLHRVRSGLEPLPPDKLAAVTGLSELDVMPQPKESKPAPVKESVPIEQQKPPPTVAETPEKSVQLPKEGEHATAEGQEGEPGRPGRVRTTGGKALEGAPSEAGEVPGGQGRAVRAPRRGAEAGGELHRTGPERGRGLDSGRRGGDKDVHPPARRGRRGSVTRKKSPNSGSDYRITPEDHIGEGSLKAKYGDNVKAVKLLKQIESEQRRATPDEQAALVRYAGWGGMPQVFDAWNNEWKAEFEELRDLLTSEEYEAARASTPNAHYTSAPVVKGMWEGLKALPMT